MADYVSSLTGVAMDSALIDMAEHTSEAYAIGERNGVPVDSSDVTYHNNARYYASQAQSIAPASVTEAVRWDVAQTALTDANKAQARENIDAGKNGAWTNPNLLDNPWFTVNQRSAATIPVGGYGVDRWKGGSAGAVTVASGGLQFVGRGNAYQIPPSGFWDSMMGKTVTASLLFSDGTVQGGSGVIGSGVTEFGTYNGVRIFKSASNNFNLESDSDANCIVRAVKLELGSVSTLANDVPPKFWSEWTECRRYFKRFKAYSAVLAAIGVCTSTTNAQFIFGDEPMAKDTVTAVYSGNLTVQSGDGSTHAISAVSASTTNGGGVVVSVTSSGLVAGDSARLRINTTESYLDLSADL